MLVVDPTGGHDGCGGQKLARAATAAAVLAMIDCWLCWLPGVVAAAAEEAIPAGAPKKGK